MDADHAASYTPHPDRRRAHRLTIAFTDAGQAAHAPPRPVRHSEPMANAIEYKSASFHVTEGKGLRDEDEQALQQLGDEGWEIVQIVPRQETNWVLVVFSRPRTTKARGNV
jgi:hypothetical protein